MIEIGDSKKCADLKGINLFRFESQKVTLSILKVAAYSSFKICNNQYCFSIMWKYFYFGISKQ